jgi:hypothetical protein
MKSDVDLELQQKGALSASTITVQLVIRKFRAVKSAAWLAAQ